MTLRNELGHSTQTDRSDDILNTLEEFEGSLTLTELAEETGEAFPDVRRAVESLEHDGRVVIDKEEPNWIVEITT
jgi:DNA-binding IclR family transcriptional regulator